MLRTFKKKTIHGQYLLGLSNHIIQSRGPVPLTLGNWFFLLLFRTETGVSLPMAVSVGDKVLLPEFGGAKVSLSNAPLHIHFYFFVWPDWAQISLHILKFVTHTYFYWGGSGGSMVVHQTVKPAFPGSNPASLQPAGTCHSLLGSQQGWHDNCRLASEGRQR